MTNARVPFICGNWKMNKTVSEAEALVDGILAGLSRVPHVEVGVAPPYTMLYPVAQKLAGSALKLSAQEVYHEASGAFTGQVSVAMLKDVGCQYTIIGHSERRSLFGETDAGCGQKVKAALAGGLLPILCVGETLEEREAEQTLEVVSRQLLAGFGEVSAEEAKGLVVAYEPVWAIGTGRTATPAQAQDVHAHLRKVAQTQLGEAFAAALRIQYGGSMKPDNAKELLAQPDIDGGLIGGAALKADSFLQICEAAES